MTRWLLLFCCSMTLSILAAVPQLSPDRGAAALDHAVRRAGTDLALLCFAAHPDDEDGATLAYYGLSRGVHTVVGLANWGEGGQNEIGPELYEDLALIRSHETLAAARLTGAEVLSMNLRDFGFSKTSHEAQEIWGRDTILKQMVTLIRRVRPDVIITNHRPGMGHGQHQAVADLLPEAVRLAADPVATPGAQTAGLPAWQVSRVYERRNLPYGPGREAYDVAVPVGTYDRLRGATYMQIAAAALREHRSQGMGEFAQSILPGATFTYYKQILPQGDAAEGDDLFAGLGGGFAPERGLYPAHPGLDAPVAATEVARAQSALAHAVELLSAAAREAVGQALAEGYSQLERLRSTATPAAEWGNRPSPDPTTRVLHRGVLHYFYERSLVVAHALTLAAGVDIDLTASDTALVRRQPFTSTARITNVGDAVIESVTARMLLPYQWRSTAVRGATEISLAPGETATIGFDNVVFNEATLPTPVQALYAGMAPPRPPIKIAVTTTAFGATWSDVADLDSRVVHELELQFEPPAVYAVRPPVGATRTVESYLELRSHSQREIRGAVTLLFPTPLQQMASVLRPAERDYHIPPGEDRVWQIKGDITSETPTGTFTIFAIAEGQRGQNGGDEQKFVVLDATMPAGLSVGVLSTYDTTLTDALRNLGANVEELSADRLAFYDLDRLDSIFVDIRAYLAHPDLPQYNEYLLGYARAGGNVVVMYQKTREWRSEYAPYPLELSRRRVTVETAPVTILQPTHPLVRWPNALEASDWEGWRQERGLYFPGEADPRYVRLVEMADPGEEPLSTGWLVADVEQGSWIYTSLVWYRQLREGHPGAYRALANMAAYPRRPR